MAVPKRKTSKMKKRTRRSHHAISGKSLVNCTHCGEPKMPHRVCSECGYYKDREIFPEEEE